MGGTCHVPYASREIPQDAPFEALYSVAEEPAASADQAPQASSSSSAQAGGLEIIFQGGTGPAPGKILVKNGASGMAADQALAPNLSPEQCAAVLVQLAFKVGLQIQSEAGGKGLKVFGSNNAVNVSGASVAVSQF